MSAKVEFIAWVKTYTKEMLSFTISKVRQKEIAEDLVQETFLSAFKSYETFKGNSNVKTWLFSILKHKIVDFYRLKFKQKTDAASDVIDIYFDENDRWKPEFMPINWGNEMELLDDPEFTETLKDCFKKLPLQLSSTIELKYLEEHDADTICSKMEISKANYWQIVHRAKLQLRNCLELKWFRK